MEILSSQEMQAIERAAFEAGEADPHSLMDLACTQSVEAIFEQWPNIEALKAVVFTGPGNNGGDGFGIARLLLERGWDVEVVAMPLPEGASAQAKKNCARWKALRDCKNIGNLEVSSQPDLIIDALFGTGLARAISGDAARAVSWINSQDCRIVAIDMPSGLGDNGYPIGEYAIKADLTVSFHRPKLGQYLGAGPEYCGRVVVKPIGLESCLAAVELQDSLNTARLISSIDSAAFQKENGHKFEHGHLIVLAGDHGKTGAARLAAKAGLRIGAGLVTIGAPRDSSYEIAAQITSIMLKEIGKARELEAVLADPRINAAVVGPGLGVSRARELLPAVLNAKSRLHVVVDADAISAFQDSPEELFEMMDERSILTPHQGEFARLFPDFDQKLRQVMPKCDVVREAASFAGTNVLLKGRDTVIATPDGRVAIHSASYDREAPWLATAGAGDVLAGMIAGLMARGFEPFESAKMASYLHVEAAREFGVGLIAEDLPDLLPKVMTGQ